MIVLFPGIEVLVIMFRGHCGTVFFGTNSLVRTQLTTVVKKLATKLARHRSSATPKESYAKKAISIVLLACISNAFHPVGARRVATKNLVYEFVSISYKTL